MADSRRKWMKWALVASVGLQPRRRRPRRRRAAQGAAAGALAGHRPLPVRARPARAVPRRPRAHAARPQPRLEGPPRGAARPTRRPRRGADGRALPARHRHRALRARERADERAVELRRRAVARPDRAHEPAGTRRLCHRSPRGAPSRSAQTQGRPALMSGQGKGSGQTAGALAVCGARPGTGAPARGVRTRRDRPEASQLPPTSRTLPARSTRPAVADAMSYVDMSETGPIVPARAEGPAGHPARLLAAADPGQWRQYFGDVGPPRPRQGRGGQVPRAAAGLRRRGAGRLLPLPVRHRQPLHLSARLIRGPECAAVEHLEQTRTCRLNLSRPLNLPEAERKAMVGVRNPDCQRRSRDDRRVAARLPARQTAQAAGDATVELHHHRGTTRVI